MCPLLIDSIKGVMEKEFTKVANYFGDMKSFLALIGELESAIGSYNSTARNIKSGEDLYIHNDISTLY